MELPDPIQNFIHPSPDSRRGGGPKRRASRRPPVPLATEWLRNLRQHSTLDSIDHRPPRPEAHSCSLLTSPVYGVLPITSQCYYA
eukprot:scaffold87814_cov35-Tisochrysis_lutea.AAC.3